MRAISPEDPHAERRHLLLRRAEVLLRVRMHRWSMLREVQRLLLLRLT
jgi:hypothetical protein